MKKYLRKYIPPASDCLHFNLIEANKADETNCLLAVVAVGDDADADVADDCHLR